MAFSLTQSNHQLMIPDEGYSDTQAYTNNIMIGRPPIALAVIEDEGRFLLGQKSPAKTNNGLRGIEFVFLGGKKNPGELPVQAAVREAWEEGTVPLLFRIVHEIAHVKSHPITGREIYYFYLEGPYQQFQLRPELPNIINLLWVPRNELLDYMPTLNPLVAKFIGLDMPNQHGNSA